MMNTVPVIPKHEQPDWMRRALRGTDWGVLLAFVLGLAVSWSFLFYPSLPIQNGSESAVYRTWETAQALQEGRLYPRWSAYSSIGYGAPIPEFMPPAATYFAAIIQLFITDDPATAVRLVYIMAICAASVGMYCFVMKQSNATAGVLAALLYVSSPYLGLTAPHALGDLSACAAMALLPALLWAISRLYKQNDPYDQMLVTLFSAGLMLTSPLYAAIALLLCIPISFDVPRRRLLVTVFSIILGGILAAFYWLPAFLEQNTIQWVLQTPHFDIPTLSLGSLFAPLIQTDPARLVIQPQMTLGWALIVCNLLALGAWNRAQSKQLYQPYLLVGLILGSVAVIWVPGETWLLGPITFCLAIGGTGILSWRYGRAARAQRLFYGATLLFVLLFAIPIFFLEPPIGNTDEISPQSFFRYEQQGFGVATVPPWERVPITHNFDNPLDANLENDYLVDDINRLVTTDNRRLQSLITLLQDGTHYQIYQIRNLAMQPVQVQQAYFPGWEAIVDEYPITLQQNPETGLIEMVLPNVNEESELKIQLGPTSQRLVAWGVTIGAVIVTLFLLRRRIRRTGPQPYYDDDLLNQGDSRIASFVILAFLGMVALANAPNNLIPLRAAPNYTLRDAIFMDNRTDAGLEALAARLSSATLTPGDQLEITLYWRTNRFLPSNYQRQLTLRDVTTGSIHWQSEFEPLGVVPTRRWVRGRTVLDLMHVIVPPDLPTGRYTLTVEIQPCENNVCNPDSVVTFFDRAGHIIGTQLTLPQVLTVQDN